MQTYQLDIALSPVNILCNLHLTYILCKSKGHENHANRETESRCRVIEIYNNRWGVNIIMGGMFTSGASVLVRRGMI